MSKINTVVRENVLPIRIPAPLPIHAGRRIIVTGGARGLGRAVATALISQGATVWLVDVLAEELTQTQMDIGAGGCSVVDIADDAAVATAVATAAEALGGLDGLVNVAGIAPHHDPLTVPRTQWERVFAVNVFGTYAMSAAVADVMMATGTHGSIVNVASEAGKKGHIDSLAYSASKAAVINLTRTMSEALAQHDINVNAVCPGGLPTDMLRNVAEVYGEKLGRAANDVFAEMTNAQLLRLTATEEVAQAISFLLSDAAASVRGQAINTDAGDTPY
jgi:NAD(P)-dependent dehydrogenase (short-subunit alcohol dehydrogenase family)